MWKPDNGSLNNPNVSNPIATPETTTLYTVYSYNFDGCLDSAYVNIIVGNNDTEFIPAGFTPNGDGVNDIFRVAHLKFDKLLDFSVYNRWGQQVFNTQRIDHGWDGRFNGEPQDLGVYNYVIIVSHNDGQLKTYKGTVTLLR
jgi:gliding motility-associated-like protein